MLLMQHTVLGEALVHVGTVTLERASQKFVSDPGSVQVRKGVPLINMGLIRITEFRTKTGLQNNLISSRSRNNWDYQWLHLSVLQS